MKTLLLAAAALVLVTVSHANAQSIGIQIQTPLGGAAVGVQLPKPPGFR